MNKQVDLYMFYSNIVFALRNTLLTLPTKIALTSAY